MRLLALDRPPWHCAAAWCCFRSHNFGLNAFWCYWWPASFIAYPFLGRVWCAGALSGVPAGGGLRCASAPVRRCAAGTGSIYQSLYINQSVYLCACSPCSVPLYDLGRDRAALAAEVSSSPEAHSSAAQCASCSEPCPACQLLPMLMAPPPYPFLPCCCAPAAGARSCSSGRGS